MLIILLPIIIKPSITYGRTNIQDRINDYIKSLSVWNIIADNIPYNIFVFENSGWGDFFDFNPKITYISENIDLISSNGEGKGKTLAAVINRFIDLAHLQRDDKILIITGRYAPISSLYNLFNIIKYNDIVISGLPGKFARINTEWFAATVDFLLYFTNYCMNYCNDFDYPLRNFESILFKIIKNIDVYKYSYPIYIVPTFIGGTDEYIEYI